MIDLKLIEVTKDWLREADFRSVVTAAVNQGYVINELRGETVELSPLTSSTKGVLSKRLELVHGVRVKNLMGYFRRERAHVNLGAVLHSEPGYDMCAILFINANPASAGVGFWSGPAEFEVTPDYHVKAQANLHVKFPGGYTISRYPPVGYGDSEDAQVTLIYYYNL